MTDHTLIKECLDGNQENFRRLVESITPRLFNLAFRMLGDEDQAKDVVQETMITAWQKMKTIRSAEAFNTWIYRIAVNRCYDELRRRKKNPEISADDSTWSFLAARISDGNAPLFENQEIAAVINILTERLSPKQKTVFILSDIDGMSGNEVSAITGMGKTLVKANLYYARKKISELLEKYM